MNKEVKNLMVVFCVWGITKEEKVLLNKIIEHFKKSISNIITSIVDLKTQEYDESGDVHVVFGSKISLMLDCKYFTCPSLSSMMNGVHVIKHKTTTMEMLKQVADYINNFDKVDQETYVETSKGITVGASATDIQITKEEAQHLINIRDILGGGKIVIVKGDTRIEVDNGQAGENKEQI